MEGRAVRLVSTVLPLLATLVVSEPNLPTLAFNSSLSPGRAVVR